MLTVTCNHCSNKTDLNKSNYKKWLKKNNYEFGYHKCRSCAAKLKWKDNEYIKKQTKSRIIAKTKISASVKSSMSQKRRNQISQAVKNNHNQGIYVEHISKLNSDIDIKNKRIKSFKTNYDPMRAAAHSARSRELWQSTEFRNNHKVGMRRISAISKMAEARGRQLANKTSTLNILAAQALNILGINYEREKQIAFYYFDFYLPDFNTLLEIDGDYWHQLPKVCRTDKAKNTYVKRHTNFTMFRIPEYVFLSLGGVIARICKLLDIGPPQQIDFDFNDVKLSDEDPCEFLSLHHYLRTNSGIKMCHTLNGNIISAAIFSHPVRNQNNDGNTLELSRFCIHPSYHKKNFATWSLSRFLKYLKSKSDNIYRVITYADPAADHDGTIYKASNWIDCGNTASTYWYISDTGDRYHKLSIWKHAQRMSEPENEFAAKRGLVRINTPPKRKFEYLY